MSDLPRFHWGQAPENLKTRKQLAELGKRPGGQQVAWLVWGRRSNPNKTALFNADEAVMKRQASPAQLEALAKARDTRGKRICGTCRQLTYVNVESGMCFDCEQEANEKRDEEAHAAAAQWAYNVLRNRPLFLDTETTDLDGLIVQIAIIDVDNNVLLDTLVNPGIPIPEDAQKIHGITDEMVASAPKFAEIEAQLFHLLTGSRVVAYNGEFDFGILHNELRRLHPHLGPTDYYWLTDVMWRDLMSHYAAWVGDWSDHLGDYKWYPLPDGDHSAVGDCRATLQLLKRMSINEPEAPCQS